MPVDDSQFKEALSHFASGVTVVTTQLAGKKFGISVLGRDQGEVSNRFASRSEDKFAGVEVQTGANGMPLIEGAITTLECTLYEQLPGGDHTIFVGEVVDCGTSTGEPLVYYRSGYRSLSF